MNLDQVFLDKMKEYLGDEYEDFLESYNGDRFYGIKVNTLKISAKEFKKISPFKLIEVPWCKDGFYYRPEECDIIPSKHPFYHAGLYYIQEPSAMSPAEEICAKPGEIILDLCASPGGKTVQIAGDMQNEGLIVSNDISTGRIKALVKNVELYGIKNTYVVNEDQFKLSAKLYNYFDKILIDAPCSGEGMFRKDSNAIKAWSDEYVGVCVQKQTSIMSVITDSLKKGGELVYSTCTFSTEENENIIETFISEHESFEKIEMQDNKQFDVKLGYSRLWPHKLDGEGHFIAHIKDNSDADGHKNNYVKNNSAPEEINEFMRENLNVELKGKFERIKDKIYIVPEFEIDIKGLRVARSGWYIGEITRGKFKPSQALAMGLDKKDAKRTINLRSNSIEAIKYLKCETIMCEGEDGLNLICVDSYPVGWGKFKGGMLKNMYPAAWRMQ
ncbi:MAG: RsmB/NOP family class I SAM-dependent RNA methyltransferase [Acidaminobacteraceae bacterium]